MADFSALIAQIEAYVKQNGNNEITGNGLQSILVGMVNALGTVAITALQGDLADEVTARQNADGTLQQGINTERQQRQDADGAINAKIPAEASSSNKLADKAFVTGLTTALQNAMNAIKADIENGYVYAGIATPSGTPVSGKVYYLARQAGTYTNFGGLTLTEGVNILKYNGTAWSQEQLISIADIRKNPLIGYYECDTAGATAAKTVAATGYVLPATGGSVKIKMANRNTVANATLNINSTGTKPLFYNGVRAGVGNTWDTNEVIEVYYDGTNYQAHNVAGSNGDGVFDVSKWNLTNGQPTVYDDLADALGENGEHVPLQYRDGGMQIKFICRNVQSIDNKYIQFRLMKNQWSINTDDWAIAEEGVYIENPEFVYVKTDAEGKILWAIKADGSIYYGAGVPQQVIDYVEEKIAELSLDEYEDIVAFLNGLEEGDKTLQNLLDEKVDKEEGKSLIDSEYAESIRFIENPEFIKVWLDAEDKILLAIKADGKTYVGDADFLNSIKNNQEAISEINATIESLDIDALISITATENPKFIQVKTDSEDKILEAITSEGVKQINLPIDTPSTSIEHVENPEYLQVTTDMDGKVIQGIKKNGSTYIADLDVFGSRIEELEEKCMNILKFLGNLNCNRPIFSNQKVSIIGDSISTFAGYIPEGYQSWYPHTGDRSSDVTSVNDTWWKKLIDATGSSLEVNASCSGSTASSRTVGFSPRVSMLGSPDVVLVALGTNDSANNVEIGEIDFNADSYDLTKFAPAYIKGIKDTMTTYPFARIICIAFDMGSSYQNVIKTVAEYYGLEYIYVGDISDIHPNKSEMQAVYERIYSTYTLTGLLNAKADKQNL